MLDRRGRSWPRALRSANREWTAPHPYSAHGALDKQVPEVPRAGEPVRCRCAVPTRNLMILLLGFSLVGLVAYAQIWGGLFFGI